MKKIVLILTAMLAMVQMNAATPAAEDAAAATTTQADDEDASVYLTPFNDNKESTKHWAMVTSGFYFGMGVKHSWDAVNNTFEIGLLNAMGVNYNSLHGQNISLGVGIHHRSYSVKRPIMLVRDDISDAVIPSTYPLVSETAKVKNRSSNLNMWTVQFPLMFTQRIVKKVDFTVAGILNWNTFARVDNHYEVNNVEYGTKFKALKQNKVNFDIMGALSYDELGIYCRYSPGKFFKEGHGPEIKNTWTLGITLGL